MTFAEATMQQAYARAMSLPARPLELELERMRQLTVAVTHGPKFNYVWNRRMVRPASSNVYRRQIASPIRKEEACELGRILEPGVEDNLEHQAITFSVRIRISKTRNAS